MYVGKDHEKASAYQDVHYIHASVSPLHYAHVSVSTSVSRGLNVLFSKSLIIHQV